MKRLTYLLSDESGSALVAGIMILMIISMLGAVIALSVNVQSHQTGNERAGEQSFNLAESVLNAEATLLEANWPTSSASAYPVCTQSSTASSTCPQGGVGSGYSSTYAGSAFGSGTWSVQVIDDDVTGTADSSFYSDAILNSSQLYHYDSNTDNKLWIRASAIIGGQTRTVVAQVQRQQFVVDLPQNVLTSGGVTTSNNGNKIIIQGTDPNSGLTGAVDVRCTSNSSQPTNGDPCTGWDQNKGQLSPQGDFQTGYVDPSTTYQTLSSGTIEQLREAAQAQGTYYAAGTCPPLAKPGLLFIENANCSYTGSGSTNWNSDSAPGAIVVASGTLTFNANINYYGIIYMVDGQDPTPTGSCSPTSKTPALFTVQGGGSIHGGVFVDKCGTINAGDSGFDITYDTKAFGGLSAYATPSLAENTFRILGNS